MPLIVQKPVTGIDIRQDLIDLDPRGAAIGTENVLFTNGVIKTPYGFSSFDSPTAGLNTADDVLFLGVFKELDKTGHTIAVTTEKIYVHDNVNSEWDDKTQSGLTMSSRIGTPVSMVAIAHDDTAIYIDDDSAKSNAYYHVVVCDGGLSNIQRWAGRYEVDFADVVGAGGYHDGTQHRALQVGSYKSRMILVSPQAYSGTSNTWVQSNQRVRWPMVGKLQTWTGTGSGFVDLIDTGGYNIWSERLGGLYYIYQDNSIWDLRYVGGTTVFSPYPVVEDLGLLSSHLLVTSRNVHYFVGNDYNVYAYYGGSVKQAVGDAIKDQLFADIETSKLNRCWAVVGAQTKRLWIFIVPSGSNYITKSYGMDMDTGSWTVRDYTNNYTTTTGITAVSLVGADSYQTGVTYQEALDTNSLYDNSDNDLTSSKYGDHLELGLRTLSMDNSDYGADWSGGGRFFYSACADANFTDDFTQYDILKVVDGSRFTNTRYGTHYYTVESIDDNTVVLISKDIDASVAVADTTLIPADVSWFVYESTSGETYNQALETVLTDEKLIIGDSSGYVYQYSSSLVTEAGTAVTARYLTKIFDWDQPEAQKRWNGLYLIAKEKTSGNGQILVSYRTTAFDTSETGWTAFTARDLSSTYKKYKLPLNKKSYQVQYKLTNVSGSDFELREFGLNDPVEIISR